MGTWHDSNTLYNIRTNLPSTALNRTIETRGKAIVNWIHVRKKKKLKRLNKINETMNLVYLYNIMYTHTNQFTLIIKLSCPVLYIIAAVCSVRTWYNYYIGIILISLYPCSRRNIFVDLEYYNSLTYLS